MRAIIRPRSGSVALVVLWILIILALMAFSIGRKASIDMFLTNYALGKEKAKFLAYSGFIFALNEIREDNADTELNGYDSLFKCGAVIKDNADLKKRFEVTLKDGTFQVIYPATSLNTSEKEIFGISEEERRLNLNALNENTSQVFTHLLEVLGYTGPEAEEIPIHLIDWRDENNIVLGKEEPEIGEYSQTTPGLQIKNRPLDSIEELLLVKGMTLEIFEKLKDFITIFPKDGAQLSVNIQTVSSPVLSAMAHSVLGVTNTYESDADSLVKKIVQYRAGPDGREATADDRKVTVEDLKLNASETSIYSAMAEWLTSKSNYLRVTVRGTANPAGVDSTLEAVVNRQDLSIHSWMTN